MTKEQDGPGILLTGVYINLKDRAIELEDEYGTVAKLTFASTGTILFNASPTETPESAKLPQGKANESSEKEQTITLTGRLKTQPKEGKPDSRGRPTAWARLAVHEEGREAHLYVATFHRHTAAVALSLARDARVTVTGYPHPSNDPSGKRLDTFSIVNLVQPGKQDDGKL